MQEASVTRRGVLDMQVCVPEDWTDKQVKRFANQMNPCGTSGGWFIRTDPKLLIGFPVRNPCDERKGFVHIMLDA